MGDQTIGVKIDDHRIMWLGAELGQPADNKRTFIYDVDRQTFHETAPVPLVKVAGQTADQDSSPLTGRRSEHLPMAAL